MRVCDGNDHLSSPQRSIILEGKRLQKQTLSILQAFQSLGPNAETVARATGGTTRERGTRSLVKNVVESSNAIYGARQATLQY